MTWFKNSIKLLVFVALAVATLQGYSSAISLTDLTAPNLCNDSNESSYLSVNYYTSNNRFYKNGNVATNLTMKSNSNSRWGGTCSDNNAKLIANGVKVSKNGTNFIFQILLNEVNTYTSIVVPEAGLNYQFRSDGQYHLLNNVYVFHDSIVLYDDNFSHTLQFLGGTTIENVVLFTNPLTSATTNGYDNFFLIDFIGKKAYSLYMLSQHIQNLFFGYLSEYNVQQFPYTSSYTLTPIENTSAFPVFNGYFENKNHFTDDLGFLYSKDLDYIAPDFGGNNNNESVPDNNDYFNSSLVNGYNECVNKGENLRKAVQLAVMCKYQDDTTERENIIYNTGLDYTGTASYCIQLDNYIVSLYDNYKDNWASGVFSYDINLQDTSAPINQLIFAWYYNSVVVGLNGEITGLPVGNSWCSAWTTTNFQNENKTRLEKIGDTFNDYFGSGISDIYTNSLTSNLGFSGMIDSISSGTNNYFITRFFNPYIEQFNSGTNAFYEVVNVPSCSNIHNGIGTYSWGNISLYGFSAILLLILLTLF